MRSQDELQRLLEGRGIHATQPTLSRDIRELGLAKTPDGYVEPGAGGAGRPGADPRAVARLERVLRGSVLSAKPAGSLVVVRTPPAEAHPVAHVVDEVGLPDVVGSIAGDDTVFLATSAPARARALARRLQAALEGAPAPRRRRRA